MVDIFNVSAILISLTFKLNFIFIYIAGKQYSDAVRTEPEFFDRTVKHFGS